MEWGLTALAKRFSRTVKVAQDRIAVVVMCCAHHVLCSAHHSNNKAIM